MAADNVRRLRTGAYVRDHRGEYGESVGYTFLAGPDDTTTTHATYPTGYEPECGWCWLNAPHTEAAHAARLDLDDQEATR